MSYVRKNVKPGPKRRSNEERFWPYVQKTESCWLWIGKKDRRKYGMVNLYREDTDKIMSTGAHRLSWKIHNGDIPQGMLVCHKCDNPSCVNPCHLFLGTYKDNVRDMDAKGRRKTISMPGALNPAAKLTNEKIEEIRAIYNTGKVSQETLARLFGVGQSSISRIVLNTAWCNTEAGGG